MKKKRNKRRKKRIIIIAVCLPALLFTGVFFFLLRKKEIPVMGKETVEAMATVKELKTQEETSWKLEVGAKVAAVAEERKQQWDSLPENLKELYGKNQDAREFVLNYQEYKNRSFEINLTEYEHCKEVPLLMQWDKRWGYQEYSGDLFGLTGCGPTCLSMAAIYLKQDVSYTPEWMREFSIRNGYSVEGYGSSWTLISEGAKQLGLSVQELPLSEFKMIESLQNGKILILVLGPGDFTDNGHYIVVTDYEEEAFVIKDPNSIKNTNKKWSYDEIEGQIKNIWALSAN